MLFRLHYRVSSAVRNGILPLPEVRVLQAELGSRILHRSVSSSFRGEGAPRVFLEE